ncbi:MAG: K(+)-transporting ATPase subunit C [Armatimonadaceae bacterium]
MWQQIRPAVTSVLVFTLFTGIVFPLLITGIAQLAFPGQARGSLIETNGRVIGSEIIGQNFTRPEYFHPRPSAAGDGYGAAASGGTNLGPTSSRLIAGVRDDAATEGTDESYAGIAQLAANYRRENNLPEGTPLPADAVTRSASGLDPHISVENAALQLSRVAAARGIEESAVRKLVQQHTKGRTLGVLGEPRVNVLLLNRALDQSEN